MRSSRWFLTTCVLAALTAAPPLADAADPQECRVVELDMVPTQDLQIVAWLERADGTFEDTLFITRLTGSFGLGNRPGMMEFNSAWKWPYGRRTTTFPVWAHRHNHGPWGRLEFQNEDDRNLSHPLGQSSIENFYCRPLREGESQWDTLSCSSTVYTDKGVLSFLQSSNYPPRADITMVEGVDDPDVAMFGDLNAFDAVSKATPPGSEPFRISWSLPDTLVDGDYVVFVEVNKEFDMNAFYNFPEPTGIPFSEYGIAYRGQPSVVYSVPFTLGQDETTGSTADFTGFGDPDGLTGMLFEPDGTITTDTPGSGASRLLLVDDGAEMYRLRASVRPTFDLADPGAASEMQAVSVAPDEITFSFVAPGDDGDDGLVTAYDIRYSAGAPITEDSWSDLLPNGPTVAPLEGGSVQVATISGLLPRTNYYIGIRGIDDCANTGPLTTLHVVTPEAEPGAVDACFIATAAYGSLMQADVTMLRGFRDRYLRTSVTGEMFVEGYYTFGPAIAQLIGPSDTLKRAARAGLAPLVDAVRDLE